MRDLHKKFMIWFRLTHWMYNQEDAVLKETTREYTSPLIQAMYLSYRAGYNKAKRESKLS